MFFIIQKEPVGTDAVQNAIIKDVLDHYKYEHSYEFMSSMDFYKDEDGEEYPKQDVVGARLLLGRHPPQRAAREAEREHKEHGQKRGDCSHGQPLVRKRIVMILLFR